jgi:hypothetical protein
MELIFKSDASTYAAGGVLYQKINNECFVLGFYSKCFNKTEIKYSTPIKETLLGVQGINHFKYLLDGLFFTWMVDAKSITLVLDSTKLSTSLLVNSLLFTLYTFNFDVKHIKRSENIDADLFSNIYQIDAKENFLTLGEIKEQFERKAITDAELIYHIHNLFHFNATKLEKFILIDMKLPIVNCLNIAKIVCKQCKTCLEINTIAANIPLMKEFQMKEPINLFPNYNWLVNVCELFIMFSVLQKFIKIYKK